MVSLKEIWESEYGLFIIAGFFFVIGLTIIFSAYMQKKQRNIDESAVPVRTLTNVTVVAKNPSPAVGLLLNNTIIVETLNGHRIELRVDNTNVFATTIVGDTGTVIYQLNKLIRFERKPIDSAKEETSDSSEYAISKPAPSSVPVRPRITENNTIVCPVCGTEQNSNRRICFKCEQKFINGQTNIPYWCGKCGHEGPYEGSCPECGSSIKKHNN